MQAVLDELDVLFRHVELRQELRLEVLDDAAVRRDDTVDDMRLVALAVGGNLAHDHRGLKRRHEVEALADGGIEGLRQVPLAVIEVLLLVAAVGDEARCLVRQVDACLCAKAEHARVLLEAVDAEAVAHLVEVDVIRVRERRAEVQPAEGLAVGIALRDDPVMAGVEDLLVRRDDALCQGSRTRDDLEGRARRVLTRDGLVVHRVVRVIVELVPVLRRDAMREKVRVEGWTADHREDLAGLRIHDDGRRCVRTDLRELLVDGLLGRLLQVDIDREFEIIARNRLLAAEDLHRLARHVDLDLLAAVLAAQLLVVDLLEAELADDVAGLVALVLHLLELSVVDLTDVAEGMRALLLEDVITDWRHFDDDTGVLALLLLDDGDDVRRDIRLDADGVEAAVAGNLRLDLICRHLQKIRQAVDDIIRDWRGQRQERDREARAIRDEQLAVAVVERAARCHRRHDADAVAVREAGVVLPLIDLQVGSPPDENGNDQDRYDHQSP